MMEYILIINLGGIGDILLSIPAMRALRDLYPQAEISMLVTSRVYEIAERLSYIDKVFTFNIRYGGSFSFNNTLKNFKALFALRKKRFDIAINMRTLFSNRSAKKIKFLLDIIKPKTRVGRDTEGKGYFFDVKIPETKKGQKYEMEYDIDTVKALGAEVIDKNIDFEIDEESIEKVNKILEKEDMSKNAILIGIHPGGMPSRRWPIENFSCVIDEVHKKILSKFLITGGREELSLAKKLMKITNAKIINLSGKLNIIELSALIKRCNLFISNDTGPMHIAAILRTPLVAIFGPGDITRFDPRNISNKTVVLYKNAECAPCEKVECKNLKCLKVISPKEVTEATLTLLKT